MLLHFFVLFFVSRRSFFYFCVFLYIIISILNITNAIKTKSFDEIKDFICENYYQQTAFSKRLTYNSMKRLNIKDLLLFANKGTKNILDVRNAKEH